jgi:hypothetical protein
MGRVIGLVVAFVMVAAGVVWTLQGLDVLGGSSMSGQHFWAIVGPAVAGLGIALGIVVLTGGNKRR